ncbi:RnfH family protein [Salinicola rhizosphaerae]|uniref:RnfH family protein n=1 Tax=Salinicola rhizosphaerae TaxID=1443141 RepID=UPI001E4AA1FB|nr:RnfH family protein [Salinicola rhizosphaerae]
MTTPFVEVAFATPTRQVIVDVALTPGMTAKEAVIAADLPARVPAWDATAIERLPIGIFGARLRDPARHELSPGDRVEVYRPLEIDPKQARRDRAARTSD